MWDLRALRSPLMRAEKPRNQAVLEMRGFLSREGVPGMDAIFCDYDIGMFTLEPHDKSEGGQFMKFETAKSRAAYHEAGHAVLKYALGLGLTRIFLRTTIAEDESGNASKAAVQELTKAYQELAAQNVKMPRFTFKFCRAKRNQRPHFSFETFGPSLAR